MLDLLLASDVAPPGIPVWVWTLLGGALAIIIGAIAKALPLLWNAARWVQKHETPSKPPAPDPHAVHVAKLNDHVLADESRFVEVRESIEASREEQRQFHNEVRELFAWLRERITRVETMIDPQSRPPVREPTGPHKVIGGGK